MSAISYNGIFLPYAYTTQFRQESKYDESDTDWFCTKFDIQVEAIVNADYLPLLLPSLVGKTDNAAVIMRAVYQSLMQPRRTLSVQMNGVELIPQATAAGGNKGTVDAQNGPRPQFCSITQLNTTNFLILWHVIAHYWENNLVTPAANQDLIVTNRVGNNTLYNRWSESIEIDNCNYSTRIREGKFVIRSDNNEGKIADQVRTQMAAVGLPPGFLRKSSKYTVDPSGLSLMYRVEDQEVFKLPPFPAYEAIGEYIESSTMCDAMRYGEVHVKLKGSKTVDQAQLVDTAVSVCSTKLKLAGGPLVGPADKRGIIQFTTLSVGMYENWVDCRIKVLFPASKIQFRGLEGIRETITTTPYSDPGAGGPAPQPLYPIGGTASFLLQAAAYYDPSLVATRVADGAQLSAGIEVGRAGVDQET
ncbi:MAG: hypothetical protein Q7O66_07890 [Dehalococcoidia bacterium]|nr:hypothetical protein [Dehalococcoidia bacterium]